MLCPLCKKESYKEDVCMNCGLVFEDHPIDNTRPIKYWDYDVKEKKTMITTLQPLYPDISYMSKKAVQAKNKNLERALKYHSRDYKSNRYDYMHSYLDIKRICDGMQLPSTILNETLNIRKKTELLDKDYFKRKLYYKHAACVKLACKIHDYPLKEKEFLSFIIGGNNNNTLKGNQLKKIVDREFMKLRFTLGINIDRFPEKPNFISYACKRLNLSHNIISDIYQEYSEYRPFLKKEYKLEGYVLAFIYLEKETKIRLEDLEKEFGISATTVSARINELKRLMKKHVVNGRIPQEA